MSFEAKMKAIHQELRVTIEAGCIESFEGDKA
jgi:hypothetical protein